MNVELTENILFRRFCYLGSFEAVCVHKRNKDVEVELYYPKLKEICEKLNDKIVLQILKSVLVGKKLVRRDEPLFAFATYLSSEVDIKWKTTLRTSIAELITADEDLFTFVKYSFLIQKLNGRKIFSTTHRKAIAFWYRQQTQESLNNMWFHHRKYCGFTHSVLIKLCNVTDDEFRSYKIFFKSSADINKETADSDNQVLYPENIMLMAKLRTTRNPEEAAEIIQKANFSYENIPSTFLQHTEVLQVLLKSMPYIELIKCLATLIRNKDVKYKPSIKICKELLENKKLIHQYDIHPIMLLIELDKSGFLKDVDKEESKIDFIKTDFIKTIYRKSFGANQATGLRIHITISLNKLNRSRKILYLKNLTEYDAAIAIAFGFFKTEHNVDVCYYGENALQLETLRWTKDMNIEDATKFCRKINRIKVKQPLIAPITHALQAKNTYDLFLVIVPTGALSNPKNKSDFLMSRLNAYRQKRNERAKYVLLDLHKRKKSMQYSETHVENILEICGVNMHSVDVINNFALNRFQ
ncbi:60 kDa SS-A/Ro ribonucleoprotein [Teleopsis dalmanni]|uniref:60 kDa SS-A/Ro ribonucleoprotein n=1 Tax=Teleopsis dalmanni TaxID=139649 RepID=UPI0018CD531B|nr:60 kDa SS-A/Ro ribonucleoprotein [Teleopsis dalmanni]